MWWRLRRPPQDDPRLSRGLQLLQTKITVLEDLSDRTDAQTKQLTAIIEQKSRALQNKLVEAEQQMLKLDHSMHKSREVAEIFQDKIPHQEIVERQRTIEYVKAARLANQGHSPEEIANAVNLPIEQVEMIAKFNRDRLMFDEESLPEWAKPREGQVEAAEDHFGLGDIDFVAGLDKPAPDFKDVERIETQFKQAVEHQKKLDAAATASILESKMAETLKARVSDSVDSVQPAVMAVKATAQTLKEKLVSTAENILNNQATPAAHFSKSETAKVKKVIFPKIEKPT